MRRDVNWEFKLFTEDLEECADWLICCGVDTVAMGIDGVYWIPALRDSHSAWIDCESRQCMAGKMPPVASQMFSIARGCNS